MNAFAIETAFTGLQNSIKVLLTNPLFAVIDLPWPVVSSPHLSCIDCIISRWRLRADENSLLLGK